MRYLFISFIALLFISCSNQTPENVSDRINQLIAEDNYTQALSILENADPEQTDADLPTLKEKTYLNYGLYLEYRGPEDSTMPEKSPGGDIVKELNELGFDY